MRDLNSPEQLQQPSSAFEEKRRRYFYRLAISVEEEVLPLYEQLYQELDPPRLGLFKEKRPVFRDSTKERLEGKSLPKTIERRHGAPEHMAVVTARAQVLADWLELNDEVKRMLTVAGMMHDAYKGREHEITSAAGSTWQSFNVAEEEETKVLRELGVSEQVIELAHGAGHPVKRVDELNARENLSDFELAFLIMFYVDNYTVEMYWATPGIIEERIQDGVRKYPGFHESAKGNISEDPEEKGFDALRRTTYATQARIAAEMAKRQGREVDSMQLPLLVDEELRKRIEAIPLKDQEA